MEQALIRRLKPGTLGAYRELARYHGRSLEAELRAVIEANTPVVKDGAGLLRLSDAALAMTSRDAPAMGSDSAPMIRRDRDTGGGRWSDEGRIDDAGR